MKLENKKALVTGGSRGIGAAVARALAAGGADVAICSRHVDEAAESVVADIERAGRRGYALQADVSDRESCRSLVDESAERLGGLNVIVHSAGGPEPGALLSDDLEAVWYRAFDVHVHSALHLVRRAAPVMKNDGEGAIVLVSSIAGIRGLPGVVPYATAKGALHQLTRSLAADLADFNLRVNCISPGIIETRFHDGKSEQAKRHSRENRIPLHREGTPEQVADAILLLVTNDFITGENLNIDGGQSMRLGL